MTNMNPFEPRPEDFAAQHLAEQQRRMQEARALVYYAHSRTGILARFLQRLADTIDPTGQARREMR
jgi:hypothetical protein